jgi:hypothetical protein
MCNIKLVRLSNWLDIWGKNASCSVVLLPGFQKGMDIKAS